jgi:hypothetical protein
MVASITRIQSLLNFVRNQVWFVIFVPKYQNCDTFSKHLLALLMSRFCPAVWWRGSNIRVHIASSVFTYRPTSLLATIKVSSLFSLWYLCYNPVESHHQHISAAHVSHLISAPLVFMGLFNGIFLTQTVRVFAVYSHILRYNFHITIAWSNSDISLCQIIKILKTPMWIFIKMV